MISDDQTVVLTVIGSSRIITGVSRVARYEKGALLKVLHFENIYPDAALDELDDDEYIGEVVKPAIDSESLQP